MKKTLVLGASLKPSRYSNLAIHRLVGQGHSTMAIGGREGEVMGVTISKEHIAYDDIHTITLYLNPKRQQAYYDYIIGLQPKRIIFNPGTENPELYQKLIANEIPFEVACTLVLLGTNQY